MKHIQVARNIVNSDEVETWLHQAFGETYEAIWSWVGTSLRKWIIKEAPAKTIVQDALPAWLRDKMSNDAQAVVLDDDLANIIRPWLDYLLHWTSQNPGKAIQQSVDAVSKKSSAWHKKLRDRAKPTKPMPEEGTTIVHTFSSGYTWRQLTTEQALANESNHMGHCVGNLGFGYLNRVQRGQIEIYSLRDSRNVPHVTIEKAGSKIAQIKGKGNSAVAEKYWDYVAWLLKALEWSAINYDEVNTEGFISPFRRLVQQELFRRGDLVAIDGRADNLEALILKDQTVVARLPRTDTSGRDLYIDTANQDDILAMIARVYEGAQFPTSSTAWTTLFYESPDKLRPVFHAEGDFITGASPVGKTLVNQVSHSVLAGQGKNGLITHIALRGGLFLSEDSAYVTDVHASLSIAQQALLRKAMDISPFTVVRDTAGNKVEGLTATVQRLRAIANIVKTPNTADKIDHLLKALKSPNLQDSLISSKAIAKGPISDATLKKFGFPTAGRTVSVLGSVLMLSAVPATRLEDAQKYVFGKPNMLRCFIEVVTNIDFVQDAFKNLQVPESAVPQLVGLLRNEYLRLLPPTNQIDDLGLPPAVVRQLTYVKGRHSAAASKAFWRTA